MMTIDVWIWNGFGAIGRVSVFFGCQVAVGVESVFPFVFVKDILEEIFHHSRAFAVQSEVGFVGKKRLSLQEICSA